jgi:hypothetical protein
MSVFEKMAKNSRLKKHAKRAGATVPNQRINNNSFPGDDGEYFMEFIKLNDFETKEGVACTEFQFRVLSCEGQEEAAGSLLNIFLMFRDDDYNTEEEVLEQFFQTCQLVGVDTKSGDIVAVSNEVKEEAVGRCIRGAVVTGKSAKKNKSLYLRGVAEAPLSSDAVEDAVEDAEEVETVEEEGEVTDWVAVGEAADEGDEEAIDFLTENGPKDEDPDDYATWSEFAAKCKEVSGDDDDDDDEWDEADE